MLKRTWLCWEATSGAVTGRRGVTACVLPVRVYLQVRLVTEVRSAPAPRRAGPTGMYRGTWGSPAARPPPPRHATKGAACSQSEADLHPDRAEQRQSKLVSASSSLAKQNVKLHLEELRQGLGKSFPTSGSCTVPDLYTYGRLPDLTPGQQYSHRQLSRHQVSLGTGCASIPFICHPSTSREFSCACFPYYLHRRISLDSLSGHL